MFLDEARLAARIHHPNVVAMLDVHCSDHLYLVMEYVEGANLAALLRHARKSGARVPPEFALRVMIDMLTGLHAAHELRGVGGEIVHLVHRDVSPQNILVGVDGVSRITDFGVAFAAARSTITQAGRLKGKLSYMSPEQVRGQAITRRSDVFAAGSVLWEALTGRPLFRRSEEAATLNAVLEQPIAPPSSVVPGLPQTLDEVVLTALERDPELRYGTAAELADALERQSVRVAAPREAALYVQTAMGPALAERRELIRRAAEAAARASSRPGYAPASALSSSKVAINAPVDGRLEPPASDDEITLKVDGATIERMTGAAPSTARDDEPDDLEHRRLRGMLAAVMLLLVGGAIGLLLARSRLGSSTWLLMLGPPAASDLGDSSTAAAGRAP